MATRTTAHVHAGAALPLAVRRPLAHAQALHATVERAEWRSHNPQIQVFSRSSHNPHENEVFADVTETHTLHCTLRFSKNQSQRLLRCRCCSQALHVQAPPLLASCLCWCRDWLCNTSVGRSSLLRGVSLCHVGRNCGQEWVTLHRKVQPVSVLLPLQVQLHVLMRRLSASVRFGIFSGCHS